MVCRHLFAGQYAAASASTSLHQNGTGVSRKMSMQLDVCSLGLLAGLSCCSAQFLVVYCTEGVTPAGV